MEPILNRAEIAELLKAIRDGRIPLNGDGGDETFLSGTPVNLFQLARPDKEQARFPNFDLILDTFSRLYATTLTNQLQRTFSINRTGLDSYEFQEFMAEKKNHGAIGILDLSPLKHGALIIYDPSLCFSMIEMMLGASNDLDALKLDRRMTTIELNILKGVMKEAGNDLDKAFAQLLELKTSLIKVENNPRLVSITDPEAEVIVGTFQLKVGQYSGEIHLVFPFATLAPLRDLLRKLLSVALVTKGAWQNLLEDELRDIAVDVTARSGSLTLSVREILNLKEGDLLRLDYDPQAPLQVLVEDRVKFYAIPGTHNGKKAISLTAVQK